MDVGNSRSVRILVVSFASFLALAACGKNDKVAEAPTGFREVSSTCSATAVQTRYLVRWKDGSVSVEHARDREEFLSEIMIPYQDEIELAENDQIVRLDRPESAMNSMAVSEPDWGQKLVEAPAVWASGVRGNGITVAVIDSGADITHPQLKNQLAVNESETMNGIDDDGNGLVDDVSGYDFNAKTGMVTDGTGHGTHVSGIVLADHNVSVAAPNVKVTGMAPEAKLLPLDFMNNEGAGSISDAVKAIHYAVSRGARVINASWGGGECSEVLRQTIMELEEKGVLMVVAAGNAGLNLDRDPEYPAGFRIGGQLTVGATSTRDIMAGFSNYSYNLVHLAAPGVNIISTVPGAKTAQMSGTSMASPFVSGAAALLMSHRPQATVAQIRQALLSGVDRDPSDPKGVLPVQTGGRLNIRKAMSVLTTLVP